MQNQQNVINTQRPIQIRKVSQLDSFSYFKNENNLSLNNAYIMIAYPSNKEIPHNYKINIDELQQYAYTYTSNIILPIINQVKNEIYNEFNTKFDMILGYITNLMGTHPDISAYWNTITPYIKQYWGQNIIEQNDFNVTIE